MMKTIVVPTDGSDHADKAVSFAADIAEKYQARLVLLHVLLRNELPENLRHLAEVEYKTESERIVTVPQSGISDKEVIPRALLEVVGRHILENATMAAKEKGVRDIETLVDDGDPASCILNCAKRQNADAIIMGSRGLGDLKGLLVGSVSHKVSHLATCTCITVR